MVKEVEQKVSEHEPEEAKAEQPKEPEAEDQKSDDLDFQFDVVDKGIEGQEEAEAEKALD